MLAGAPYVLAQGMLDLGLLDKSKAGTAQDVIEQRAYFQFYMHRTGHWLGMDVHDCGSYVEPGEEGAFSERRDPLSGVSIKNRPARRLAAGMVRSAINWSRSPVSYRAITCTWLVWSLVLRIGMNVNVWALA